MSHLRLAVHSFVHVFVIATFLASVACHVLTYFGIDMRAMMPYVMFLHLAVMAGIFPAFWLGGGLAADDGSELSGRGVDGWIFGFCLLFIYTGFNFVFWVGSNNQAVIHRPDGSFYLEQRRSKNPIREVTIDEARWHRAHQFRSLSGHWVFFSTVGVLQLASRRWLPPVVPLVQITPRAAEMAESTAKKAGMLEYWRLRLEADRPDGGPAVRHKLDIQPFAPKLDEETWFQTGGICMTVPTAQLEMLRGCTVDYATESTDHGLTVKNFVVHLPKPTSAGSPGI